MYQSFLYTVRFYIYNVVHIYFVVSNIFQLSKYDALLISDVIMRFLYFEFLELRL